MQLYCFIGTFGNAIVKDLNISSATVYNNRSEKQTNKIRSPHFPNCSLSPATTPTVVMTAVQRTPWTLLHHSASSLWEWVRSTCPNTATTTTTTTVTTGMVSETPPATAPLRLQASPTRCRLGLVCALTSRRVASPSTMPTLCDLCGKVM